MNHKGSGPYSPNEEKKHTVPRPRVVHVGADFNGCPRDDTIYLGPGAGFGSGRHPTTCMCIRLLESLFAVSTPVNVLDAGTGNGILAIAAKRLGADRVLGVEKEEEAAETARNNILLNRMEKNIRIQHGDVRRLSGSYDLILANLCPDQISQLAGDLEKRLACSGDLILSGLRGFETNHTLKILEQQRGLILLEDLWDQGWSALWMHKPA